MKVTSIWSDETTDFRTTNSIVPKGNVISEIIIAILLEKNKTINMQQTRRKFFTLPLSKLFIEQTFGEGSVQCLSGLSVVIINDTGKKSIYRLPVALL